MRKEADNDFRANQSSINVEMRVVWIHRTSRVPEVISIVVVITNFLNILYKAEEMYDLEDAPKLQKYKCFPPLLRFPALTDEGKNGGCGEVSFSWQWP